MDKQRKQQAAARLSLFLLAAVAVACTRTTPIKATMPDPDDYKKVRDAKDWLNPFLIVEPDGVTFICNALAPNERKHFSLPEIKDYLKKLPANAWPYGKMIGLQENGIRSGNDTQLIVENKKEVERILESLKIKSNWWPS